MHDDVLFAYNLDGKPLAAGHGGPLRLVVPGKYGYKNAKWVRRVRFTEIQELGYWESRDTATPRTRGKTTGTDSLTMPEGNLSDCLWFWVTDVDLNVSLTNSTE